MEHMKNIYRLIVDGIDRYMTVASISSADLYILQVWACCDLLTFQVAPAECRNRPAEKRKVTICMADSSLLGIPFPDFGQFVSCNWGDNDLHWPFSWIHSARFCAICSCTSSIV